MFPQYMYLHDSLAFLHFKDNKKRYYVISGLSRFIQLNAKQLAVGMETFREPEENSFVFG
jgi:hypothetical protein